MVTQMIKLIPVPKITKRELMTALMEGRRFCVVRDLNDNAHDMIEWDENYGNNPVRNGAKNWDWRGFCFLHEITESHWYDNIPEEGIPCRVWDHAGQEFVFDFVMKYDKSDRYPFITNISNYHEATPILPSECYQEPV